jgi:hypothetical protein
MIELLGITLACGAISAALAITGRRACGPAWPVAEVVMFAAMLDVHLPALGVVPAPLWSLLLMGCAIGAALSDRMRQGRDGHSSGDHLHAAGMLLGAVLVLLVGAASGSTPGTQEAATLTQAAVAHSHGAVVPVSVALVTAVAVGAYAAGVVVMVVLRRPARVEVVRRIASLAGLVTMAVMAVMT